jgi:hypothetical protein
MEELIRLDRVFVRVTEEKPFLGQRVCDGCIRAVAVHDSTNPRAGKRAITPRVFLPSTSGEASRGRGRYSGVPQVAQRADSRTRAATWQLSAASRAHAMCAIAAPSVDGRCAARELLSPRRACLDATERMAKGSPHQPAGVQKYREKNFGWHIDGATCL